MVNDWEKVTLVDHCQKIGSGATPRGGSSVYLEEGEIALIRSQNIYNEGFSKDGLVYITVDAAEKLKNVIVEEDDILLNITGDSVARVCMVDNSYLPARVNQHVSIIRPKAESFNAKFLRYYLTSPYMQQLMLNYSSAGATRKALTKSMIENLEVLKPSIDIQNNIAYILSTLDDKIELNRQMNETLEAMVQAMFKSWFVDFDPVIDNALLAGNDIPEPLKERAELRQAQLDSGKAKTNSKINDLFPSEFEFTEELGWIPKGWSVGEVGDIVDRLKVKKRYKKSDVMSFGKTPVFEQGSNILLGFHNKIADIQADVENPAFIFGDHTCVINLSLEPFSVSANVIPLVGKNYPTYWVYYAVHGKQSFEEYRRHWMELIIKTTILPTNDVANLYMSHIKHLKEKQMRMLHTSNTLMEIRDKLLPKLMSGELRIPDAEKLVENI